MHLLRSTWRNEVVMTSMRRLMSAASSEGRGDYRHVLRPDPGRPPPPTKKAQPPRMQTSPGGKATKKREIRHRPGRGVRRVHYGGSRDEL